MEFKKRNGPSKVGGLLGQGENLAIYLEKFLKTNRMIRIIVSSSKIL